MYIFLILSILITGPAHAVLNSAKVQKLLADDRAADDEFGTSVSVDGDTALIGAPYDGDNGSDSGSAYVFIRLNGVWVQQQKLVADDGADGDEFGTSVSLSGDTALIGSYYDGDNGSDSGSAYVFIRLNGVWAQQQKLVADDGAADDEFGTSVSLSGDTALVGAPEDDDVGLESGSAYVFTRSGGGAWSQQDKLVADDGTDDAEFGISVSLSGDTALVGAAGDDSSGSAYVFTRSVDVWSQQAKLIADDTLLEDWFGISVSIDGDTALIGAEGNDDVGSAYVFTRSGGAWSQQAKLIADDGAVEDYFGVSVSVSGETAIIGAEGDDDAGLESGSAYVFTKSGGVWSQQAKLIADDGALDNWFGVSVSVSGETAIIGAEGNGDTGSAYVYGPGDTGWLPALQFLLGR